jgi:uncharacterized protein YeaO (DUF488 family)
LAVYLKRAYEAPAPQDGDRFLVERLWPRGVKKAQLALSGWLKDLAPTSQLRKWYGHLPERWPEFARLYKNELAQQDKESMLADLRRRAQEGAVTLVFATRLAEHSGAAVLREVLLDSGSLAPAPRLDETGERHARSH